jgi:hypothetical protein
MICWIRGSAQACMEPGAAILLYCFCSVRGVFKIFRLSRVVCSEVKKGSC